MGEKRRHFASKLRTHVGGGGGAILLYISIAYYMQKGRGKGVQRACKNAYVINGRPL